MPVGYWLPGTDLSVELEAMDGWLLRRHEVIVLSSLVLFGSLSLSKG